MPHLDTFARCAGVRFWRLALLGSVVACGTSDEPLATSIPRHTGQLDSAEARAADDSNYAPSDAPLAWQHEDSLLIAHVERYVASELVSSTCGGSGIFSVPVRPGIARPLAVGQPACEAIHAFSSPAMDRTGRWIAFSVDRNTNTSLLALLDLATGKIDTLVTGCSGHLGYPAWESNGETISFRGLCDRRSQAEVALYSVDISGSNLRQIVRDREFVPAYPKWSTDGRLAYARRRASPGSGAISDIVVLDTLGAHPRIVARGHGPAWSPDGQQLAYIARRLGEIEATEIRVVRADGSADRLVFRNNNRDRFPNVGRRVFQGIPAGPLVWSPDGQWLAFRRHFADGSFVWRSHVGTGDAHPVTERQRE
jgi:hypothetical protein